MKSRCARVVALTVCAVGMFSSSAAYSCVVCIQSPEVSTCLSGQPMGFNQCWVSVSCWTAEPCGGGGCFLPGTLVETADGPRALEEVQVGDLILGVDDNGEHVLNQVVGTIRSLAVDYYVINGTVEVTGTHPFLVDQCWVLAEDLCVGDALDGADGAPLVVQSITRVERGVRTFNLSVSGSHTFFADGVLVHNKDGDPEDPPY